MKTVWYGANCETTTGFTSSVDDTRSGIWSKLQQPSWEKRKYEVTGPQRPWCIRSWNLNGYTRVFTLTGKNSRDRALLTCERLVVKDKWVRENGEKLNLPLTDLSPHTSCLACCAHYFNPHDNRGVRTITIIILQMRKLRPRRACGLPQAAVICVYIRICMCLSKDRLILITKQHHLQWKGHFFIDRNKQY